MQKQNPNIKLRNIFVLYIILNCAAIENDKTNNFVYIGIDGTEKGSQILRPLTKKKG